MKYLTKEWYELCQQTALHFDMKAHSGCDIYDEALYLRLYKIKEEEFIKMQWEAYDYDPRFLLEQDGCEAVPLEKFAAGEGAREEDKVVYHMPPEVKDRIREMIEEYDARPPFDEEKCREEFRSIQEMVQKEYCKKLPHELFQTIADIRVFSLGYCTGEILRQLRSQSKENEKKMKQVLDQYSEALQREQIPHDIRGRFGFHDCRVAEFTAGEEDIAIRFDTEGGFTHFNRITFAAPQIIKQEEHIVGSTWLYEELYRTEDGYEAHMLFSGEGMPELTLRCKDILVDEI